MRAPTTKGARNPEIVPKLFERPIKIPEYLKRLIVVVVLNKYVKLILLKTKFKY